MYENVYEDNNKDEFALLIFLIIFWLLLACCYTIEVAWEGTCNNYVSCLQSKFNSLRENNTWRDQETLTWTLIFLKHNVNVIFLLLLVPRSHAKNVIYVCCKSFYVIFQMSKKKERHISWHVINSEAFYYNLMIFES